MSGRAHGAAHEDAPWLKAIVLTVVAAFLVLVLLLPMAVVFVEALRKGLDPALAAIRSPDAQAAIRLTLITAAITVPFNAVFGVCAAWAVAKHRFPGKALLITLIDLPFSVSPVVAGLIYVLIFGAQGWFGEWLLDHGRVKVAKVPYSGGFAAPAAAAKRAATTIVFV